MKNRNLWRESIVLVMIFILLYFCSMMEERYETATLALEEYSTESSWEFVELVDHSPNTQVAFFVQNKRMIKVVYISKNMFGWKTSFSIESSCDIRDALTEGIDGFSSTANLTYGTFDGLNDYEVMLNSDRATLVKVKNHNYTIWFICEVYDFGNLTMYDENKNMIIEMDL